MTTGEGALTWAAAALCGLGLVGLLVGFLMAVRGRGIESRLFDLLLGTAGIAIILAMVIVVTRS